jgi:hypothetical protein
MSPEESIKPPRPVDVKYQTEKSLDDLAVCITNLMNRSGRSNAIPLSTGIVISYFFTTSLINPGGESKFQIHLTELGDLREITAEYRHPLSKKSSERLLRDAAKKCFAESEASQILEQTK